MMAVGITAVSQTPSEIHRANNPANTRRQPNVSLVMCHRLRRWLNTNPTLGQHLVFAGTRHFPNAGSTPEPFS